MLKLLLLYPAEVLVLLTTLAVLFRIRLKPAAIWTVAIGGALIFLVFAFVDYPHGHDLGIFWKAGSAWWRGEDPYAARELLNPPTALILFADFAALPFGVALGLWTALNALGGMFLVVLAYRTLQTLEGPGQWGLPGPVVAVLAAAVALSFACRDTIQGGQLSVLMAWLLVAAVWAQERGRSGWAGASLALGSIKAATMLPFLLLFLRKKDRRLWVAMTGAGLGLCLLTTGPQELPARCQECLANIAQLGLPGKTNDYSYSNPNNANMIALDHAFYRLGIRDRSLVRGAQLVGLALLGAWVAWQVLGSRALPRGAACCQVTLYAALFLYHRQYDMILLALPLVYCTGRARSDRGAARGLFVASTLAILAVLYLRVGLLKELRTEVGHPGVVSWLVEALVLPYGTWSILTAMGCLWAAERARVRVPSVYQRWSVSVDLGTSRLEQSGKVLSSKSWEPAENPAPANGAANPEYSAVSDTR